jgi:DNA-binding LacI/PurR family transcriptional regulator
MGTGVKKITMKGIAKLAGTSVATVSRTFRTPDLVQPDTREHILSIARNNQYVYNATAGDLSRKKSTVIGVLVPTTHRSLFGNPILAIQDKTQEKNFSIIIGNTKYDLGIERRLLRQFQERSVAGLILTGYSIGQEKFINH